MVCRVWLLPLQAEGKSAVMLSGPDLLCCWECNFLTTITADKRTHVHATPGALDAIFAAIKGEGGRNTFDTHV